MTFNSPVPSLFTRLVDLFKPDLTFLLSLAVLETVDNFSIAFVHLRQCRFSITSVKIMSQ